jgi:hypothetical protein
MFAPSDLVIIGVLAIILPLAALVNLFRSKFEHNDKLIWLVTIIFIPVLGPTLYFLVARKHKLRIN